MAEDHTAAKNIAENLMLRAAHQIFTVIGIPLVLGISGWTLKSVVDTNERMAVVETLKPRIDRLEHMADSQAAMYPMADGRTLERQVQRLDGRVIVLERTVKNVSNEPVNEASMEPIRYPKLHSQGDGLSVR